MVYLQKLHEKYAEKGLVVLGFNSADQHQIAVELMGKLGLTFPCVLDSSPEAQLVCWEEYRSTAVPTTYIIDREGRIADAWIGFTEKDARAEAALKKMKLD